MGSLVALMNSSLLALKADQAALDATSNNVANQNTVGYTREVVEFQANDIVTLNGSSGDGVNVGSGPISQRDRVLGAAGATGDTDAEPERGGGVGFAAGAECLQSELELYVGQHDGAGLGYGCFFQLAVGAGQRSCGDIYAAECFECREYAGCAV